MYDRDDIYHLHSQLSTLPNERTNKQAMNVRPKQKTKETNVWLTGSAQVKIYPKQFIYGLFFTFSPFFCVVSRCAESARWVDCVHKIAQKHSASKVSLVYQSSISTGRDNGGWWLSQLRYHNGFFFLLSKLRSLSSTCYGLWDSMSLKINKCANTIKVVIEWLKKYERINWNEN